MRWTQTLLLLAATAYALDSAGWRTQSIYQVVTDRFARTDLSTKASCSLGNYCGGTFQGLIKKLDYIQGMGFTAVWISPVIANLNTSTPYGLPYHGYWPQDNYAINPNFGTAQDLVALSSALHKRGMYLMVDVVPNHMAFNGAPATIDYTILNPFNKASYFHQPYCAIDYNNATSVQVCWMGDTVVSLPDLKSEDATVQAMWNSWVTGFVANYSIDGLRVDSTGQMAKTFFPDFVTAGGVYQVGEVLNGNPDTLCDYQKYITSVLNYAYYFWIVNSFSAGGSLTTLSNNIGWLKSTCSDVTIMPTFMENHDQPRWPSFETDASLISNAIAFTVLSDGIPLIYYGQEQGFSGAQDPNNREPMWPSTYDTTTTLYQFITGLNTFRSFIISKDSTYAANTGKTLYSDASTLVRQKGAAGSRVITVWSNDGANIGSRNLTLSTSLTALAANTAMTDVVSCTVYNTDASGNLVVTIQKGMPLSLFNTNGLKGSNVCTNSTTAAPNRVVGSSVVSSSSSTSTSSSVTFTSSTLSTSTIASAKSSSSSLTSTSVSSLSSTSSSSVVKSTSTSSASSTSTSLSSTSGSSVVKSTSTSSSSSTSTSLVPSSTSTSPTTSSVVSSTTSKITTSSSSSGSASSTSSPLLSSSIPPTSSGTKTSSTSTKIAACTPAASVILTFQVNAPTIWGQNVYLTGSSDELNSWSASTALTMSADAYPIWMVNVTMAVGEDFHYKFIKSDGSTITWEADPDRTYTVPIVTACSVSTPVATIGGSWQPASAPSSASPSSLSTSSFSSTPPPTSSSSASAVPAFASSSSARTSSSAAVVTSVSEPPSSYSPSSTSTSTSSSSRTSTSSSTPEMLSSSYSSPQTTSVSQTSASSSSQVPTYVSSSTSSRLETPTSSSTSQSPSSSGSLATAQLPSSTSKSSSQTTSSSAVSTAPAQASSTLAISNNNICGADAGFTCFGSSVPKGGQCCSRYNACGSSADYCCPQRLTTGGGCQGGYGTCLDITDPICVAAASPSSSTSTAPPSSTSSKSSSTSSSSTSTSTSSSTSSTVSSAAPSSSTIAITTNNKCGAAVGLTCLGSSVPQGGQCCSRYNSCGATADYCCPQRLSTGGGCQGGYGTCFDASDSRCI